MRKKWSRQLIIPLIISLIISSVVVYAFIINIPQFFLIQNNESGIKNNVEYYYSDLDNDGVSELVQYYHYDNVFQPTLYVYNSNDSILGLWNFFDKPINESSVFFDDFTHSNQKEIILFSHNSDSLFYYVFNLNSVEFIVERQFVCKSECSGGFNLNYLGLYKHSVSGNNKALFYSNCDHKKVESFLFTIDVKTKDIELSSTLNSEIISPILIEDINNDNSKEIYLSTKSTIVSGKYNPSLFVALNEDLDFLFSSKIFEGGKSITTLTKTQLNNKPATVVLNSSLDSLSDFTSVIFYDFDGKKKKESLLEYGSGMSIIPTFNNKIFAYNNKCIAQLNSDLQVDSKIKLNQSEKYKYILSEDLNSDGIIEMVFKGKNHLMVIDELLKNKSVIPLSDKNLVDASIRKTGNNTNELFLQFESRILLFEYKKNETILKSYLSHILIFIVVFGLAVGLQALVQRRKNILRFLLGDDEEEKLYQELEKNINENVLEQDGVYSQKVEEKNKHDDRVNSIHKEECKSVIELEFNKIIAHLELKELKVHFFPLADWCDVKQEFRNKIFELVNQQLLGLKEFIADCNSCKIQFFKHKKYINVLIEVEDFLIVKDIFSSSKQVNSLVNELEGKLEIAHVSDLGTIVNTMLPIERSNENSSIADNKIKLVLAEDHDVSLFGLTSLFKRKEEFEIVGTAKNGMEVLKILKNKKIDIVITDISMPGMDGIELSEQIKNQYPEIKVIVFTMYLENWFVEQLVNNGAMGFVSKNSKITELVSAVQEVNKGSNYYCPQFKSKFGFNGKNSNKSLDSLSKNELEIIAFYGDGLSKEQIAEKLTVSNDAMDSFLANILLKLKASDEEEIIRIAKKQKYITE